jgi:hypothetical protein
VKKKMKIHKSSKGRMTACGLEYDNFKDLANVVRNHLAGHWKRVTCENCLNTNFKKINGLIRIPRKLTKKEREDILNIVNNTSLQGEDKLDLALRLSILKVFS